MYSVHKIITHSASMHSSQQADLHILSSQVAVDDGGFASLALKTRAVSIINNPDQCINH